MDPLTVVARKADLTPLGQIDDYQELTAIPRYVATGAWTLDISDRSNSVPFLDPRTNPGGGVIIRSGPHRILSGTIDHFGWKRSESDGTGKLTIAGKDDNLLLEQRLVYPVPTADIPSQGSTAFYSVSGASTSIETLMRTLVNLNAGPGSLPARRIPSFTLQTDLGRGSAPDYRADFRFETLLDALSQIARAAPSDLPSPLTRGGLGFRIVQNGSGLEFEVYDTVGGIDSAKFSFDLGNITDSAYDIDAPSASVAILGAGRTAAFTDGPQVAANLFEYSRTDDLFPNVYAEKFVDVGEIDPAAADVSERLQTAADQLFDTAAGQIGLTITPVDTESMQYGRDWNLGDFVTSKVPYLTFQEQVREVQITSTPDDIVRIQGVIGTVDGAYKRRTPGVYRRLTELTQLMQKKEVTL